MNWLRRFYSNHVVANLSFVLVLVLGIQSYSQMPRVRDPEVNFNFIIINTILPGASAEEVERRITDPLEDSISRSIQDLDFVTSTSRDGVSTILIRFVQIDEDTFEKRLIDLRREVTNTYTDELPSEAEDPSIQEVTSSSSLPAATVVVTSEGAGQNLLFNARNLKNEMERIEGVDRVAALGLPQPELHVSFEPQRLRGLGITPADLADTVRAYFRDVSVGDIETESAQWIVRFQGTDADPSTLAAYPLLTSRGVVTLGSVAEVFSSTEEASELVRYQNRPAVMLSITKKGETNELDMLAAVRSFIDENNQLSAGTGVELVLVDDQTIPTREALSLMQNNALIGLLMVLVVTWCFLGSRIALLTSIGIPFTLAGTFIILHAMGMTLNTTVLLGVVISLGMIVDDAVVVVEAIYYRLGRGMGALDSVIESLREVFAPVTTSILTTMAAFLPLMLLPGILGEFMKVIPITVCVALAVSLLEAYWMLPAHISGVDLRLTEKSKTERKRVEVTHWIRLSYTRALVKVLRYPKRSLAVVLAVFLIAMTALGAGMVRFNFFAGDALRVFYVNVDMPKGTTLAQTMEELQVVEKLLNEVIEEDELRASVAFSGQRFTQTEQLFGDNVGQVVVSLNPDGRPVKELVSAIEERFASLDSGADVSLLVLEEGPPVLPAISAKVRGTDFVQILAAVKEMRAFMEQHSEFTDINVDYRPGNPELELKLDGGAIKRAGLPPAQVIRSLQALVDGELVTQFQDKGEEVNVRVLAKHDTWTDIDTLLRQPLSLPGGSSIAVGDLVTAEYGFGQQNIRHYNFRRSITIQAGIDESATNTVVSNALLQEEWQRIKQDYPGLSLDLSGQLDDIEESLDAMAFLTLMGIGLIYLILGTQFGSYLQPLLVLTTIPLAITGVVFGLLLTNNPMSLYTLYGVVALLGISVNASIVLISAANDRIRLGMSLLHATIYAARRRVIPIIITSLTTIAGLFSLAAGLAGESLVWGPVATAIVSGLAFATVLTLFVIPLLYRTFMARSHLLKSTAHLRSDARSGIDVSVP